MGADAIPCRAAEQADDDRERGRAKDEAVRLVVDHAVPLVVMVRQLFEADADVSRKGIRAGATDRGVLDVAVVTS